ncbi:MAG: DUF192 domain-containing protein [Bacteriovoracaceae bacterium]|nr:DUF192 domain-containing protein [Bacteriovoracaceae bacterium]
MTMLPLPRFKLNRILPVLLLTLLAACNDPVEKDPAHWGWLIAPQDKILTKLAISLDDQVKGFSGTRDEDWPDDQGIIFLYDEDGPRAFWMPDTYFDLDLFFIDKDLKIIDIERKVPHFIGRTPEDRIPRIRSVWARHVLELKSKSSVSQKLKLGDQLKFHSPAIPQQIK